MTNFQPLGAIPARNPTNTQTIAPANTRVEHAPADEKLFRVAQELEASFLTEMLKSAGFGKSRDTFGGGAGEEQFSSFLTQAHATAMVKTGGIGLAQSIFDALKERENDQT